LQRIGMCFDRTFPPGAAAELAQLLEAGGVDQLWVIEDCFFTSAPPLAAAALTATSRLQVGVGILPAVTRTAALVAMELATLERMAPGRVVGGIGHGVQSWMAQMGVAPSSPLGALEEVLTAVRALLAGHAVDVRGSTVTLDDVALSPAPDHAPPVLAGVRGPRSLEVAGRAADGLVLAEWIGPTYVRGALEAAGRPDPFRVATYSTLWVDEDPVAARRGVAPQVAEQLRQATPNIAAHPYFEDLQERLETGGLDALASAPDDWWHELGAVGTFDDAVAHMELMYDAGVDDVALFPASDFAVARRQVPHIKRLAEVSR
jgi:alkanesulfonate monooxygenase SsuD/methylene tetrahydromethanopterin reductase-like flavin-dependent oxidoreductase (luciferase family)